jgi:16S rRNA (cytosine1402-N4)-methyltransferase
MYHVPVLFAESIEGLAIQADKVYVDATFGGGGHSKGILEKISGKGKLIAFDQDNEAAQNAEAFKGPHFQFVQANFRYLKQYLKMAGIDRISGLMADLGISSHQIDTAERGFSTRFDAALDMRMNQNQALTAKEVINSYPQDELHQIFGMYGEVKNAKSLAAGIVSARTNRKIGTTGELKEILNKFAPKHSEFQYQAQVFQSLRITVNDELKALENLLVEATDLLEKGGRLVILSYHSLEDRIVKNFMNSGKFHGEAEKDVYGNNLSPIRQLTKKPITASEEEIKLNNRARSAKLRIGEKI